MSGAEGQQKQRQPAEARLHEPGQEHVVRAAVRKHHLGVVDEHGDDRQRLGGGGRAAELGRERRDGQKGRGRAGEKTAHRAKPRVTRGCGRGADAPCRSSDETSEW